MDAFGGNLKKYFALPDYQTIMRGFTKNDDDVIDSQEQVQDPHISSIILFSRKDN
jgi:hypothetical protein